MGTGVWLALAAVGAFAVVAAGVIHLLLARRSRPGLPGGMAADPVAFLFEGAALLDATPAAHHLIRGLDRKRPDLSGVLDLLARRFGEDLRARVAALAPGERLRAAALSGPGLLEARAAEGSLRLAVHLGPLEDEAIDRLALESAREELSLLRALAEDAPQLVWMIDGSGGLAWANRAYLEVADLLHPARGDAAAGVAWPAAPLLETPADLAEGQVHQRRLALPLPGEEEPLWLEVTSVRRGAGSMHFATDVGRLVRAEAARSQFVQTLAKTFAHLDTGLAIFDRQRRLVLFNPAFLDLTGLPPAFLSARPLVSSVLDRLRDSGTLPEPRDYATWREQVMALEDAAERGQYCETWTLPGGQTYRVTGRPHPDGALAFLFEDISDEISLTRRARAEAGLTQAVLDSLDEGLAVFSATGLLTLSNARYAALAGPSPRPLGERSLQDELRDWEALAPSPLWARLAEEGQTGRVAPADEVLRCADGRLMSFRVLPMGGGTSLVGVRMIEKARSPRPASTGDTTRPPARPASSFAAKDDVLGRGGLSWGVPGTTILLADPSAAGGGPIRSEQPGGPGGPAVAPIPALATP